MVQYFHSSINSWADKFFNELGRKYYVTPTSFLELIKTFQDLLKKNRLKIQALIDKYKNGYDKIISTESSVGKMQKELQELAPQIKKAAQETSAALIVVAKEKEEADKVKVIVEADEAVASKKKKHADKI